jgi:hypothetical protein
MGLTNGVVKRLEIGPEPREMASYRGHKGAIKLIYALNEGFLVTYARDETAKLFNAATGELLTTYELRNFQLKELLFSIGRVFFVSSMNIFGGFNYTPMEPVSTSPRTAAFLGQRRFDAVRKNPLSASL